MPSGTRSSSFTVATSVAQPSWKRSKPLHRSARSAAITTRVLGLPDVVEVGTDAIYVLHNLLELDLDPEAAGFTAVLSGHSHKPVIEKRSKILFVNPGSAGPRRFRLPVTVATLALRSGRCEAKIVELALCQQSRRPGRSD